MQSDPRIGMVVSLTIAFIAALWLCGQWIASEVEESLFPALGYGTHALTLLSLFLLLAGSLAALLFRRYATVRTDLMADREVIARWTVDPGLLQSYSATADARDREEKRGALLLILFFVALIFGGFALFDPEVAPQMMAMAVGFALILTAACWWSNRVRGPHLQFRSGEIIVGRNGLLVSGVLHVWGIVFLSWLVSVRFENRTPRYLNITYAYLARYGPRYVSVWLPVPPEALEQAEKVKRTLGTRQEITKSSRSRRPGT